MLNIRKLLGCANARLIASIARIIPLLTLTLGFSLAWAARDRTPPTKPTNLRVTAKTAYTATVAWSPSTDNSGNFSYVLADTASPSQRVTLPKTATSFTFSGGLYPRNSYTFIIQAVDAAGNSSSPISVSATLPADTRPPTLAPVVSVSDVGSRYVSLAWTASQDDGPVLYYYVLLNGSFYATANTDRFATLSSLEPATTYTFTVQASDYGGNLSPVSNPVTVTTQPASTDSTPPTTPANLTDNGMSFPDGETWLFWTQSTDDQTPQSAIRYDVYLNGEFHFGVVGTGGPQVDYGVPGALNTWQVVAVDAEGNESSPATLIVDLR